MLIRKPSNIVILGAGGCGRSVLALMDKLGRKDEVVAFMETSEYFKSRKIMGLPVESFESFDPDRYKVLLALGTSAERAACREKIPSETIYSSCVHPKAFFLEPLDIRPGTIIFPNTYFSRNIQLGPFALILPGTILGHDLVIGADFTSSEHVSVGGNVQIGERVYCGMKATVRDHISICDDAVLGMGTLVTRSLSEAGTYVGQPARMLLKE